MNVYIHEDLFDRIDSDELTRIKVIDIFNSCQKSHHLLHILDNDESLYESPYLGSFHPYIKNRIKSTIYGEEQKSLVEKNDTGHIKHLIEICADTAALETIFQQLQQDGIPAVFYADKHRLVAHFPDETTREYITLDFTKTYLIKPLKILVENKISDASFVETCLKYFAELDHEPEYEFENGGGSGCNALAEHAQGKNRVVCIIDSDESTPGNKPDDKVKYHEKLIKTCETFGYTLHILQKREMENYLPRTALDSHLVATGKHFACKDHAYFTLSPEQQDHFDMKLGLQKRHVVNDDFWSCFHEQAASATSDKSQIVKGFGEDVWTAFTHITSREELDTRDTTGELSSMVNKILKLL